MIIRRTNSAMGSAPSVTLTPLSEPSAIVLEHILVATDRQEQFAIAGRVAMFLDCSLKPARVDIGVQSTRFITEARRREVSPNALVQMLIARIVAEDLFDAILDRERVE